MTLSNPLLPIADPFVVQHGGAYYVTGTHTTRSLELWTAPNLAALSTAQPITVWTPATGEPSWQVWSPTMFLLPYQASLHWFLYFTASSDDTNARHRIYVLQSAGADPLGPYTFRGQIAGMADATTIDPSILSVNGRHYLLYVDEPGTGAEPEANVVCIAPLADPLTLAGAGTQLIYPDQPWERGAGSDQSRYPVAEGPTALYHAGRVFIVYSASHTGNYNYCLGLLTYNGQGDPTDRRSWTKSGPVFTHSAANGVFGPGRAAFTTASDGREDWMLYHAKHTAAFDTANRTTKAQRFGWHADGTPDFGQPVAVDKPSPHKAVL